MARKYVTREEKLQKMYEGIINGDELKRSVLDSYGFKHLDYTELRQQGILIAEKRGIYKLTSFSGMIDYAVQLIKEKEYEKAQICFEKILNFDTTNKDAFLGLFLIFIAKKEYNEALNILEILKETNNKSEINDYNYYLYILSLITKLKDEDVEKVKKFTFDDIRILEDDYRYDAKEINNSTRKLILEKKITKARQKNKTVSKRNGKMLLQDLITNELIQQAHETEILSKNSLLACINQKEYDELGEILEEKNQRNNLSILEEYILKLLKILNNIKETSTIPNIEFKDEYESILNAIDCNDFKKALDFLKETDKDDDFSYEYDIIKVLLSDILKLINEIDPQFYEKNKEKYNQDKAKNNEKNEIDSKKTVSLNNIIDCLSNNDLEKAYEETRNYLDDINKREFASLVLDLIKLSILEEDSSFLKPMYLLTMLPNNDFSFDSSYYIANFYKALEENKIDQAKIYLDIISQASKLSNNHNLTDDLRKILELTTKKLESKKINDDEKPLDEPSEKKTIFESKNKENSYDDDFARYVDELGDFLDEPLGPIDEFDDFLPTTDNSDNQIQNSSEKQTSVEKESQDEDELREFLKEQNKRLICEGGIIRLEPMEEEKRHLIHRLVKEFPDMRSFSILEDEQRQVVLRYKPYNQNFDYGKILKSGNDAYTRKDYDQCISDYSLVLESSSFPKAFVYGKLGMAYYKKGDMKKAIDYLIVATDLGKRDPKRDVNYEEFIDRILHGEFYTEDKKRVKFKNTDFIDETQSELGIPNFEEVIQYCITNNLDFETACEQLNYSSEEKDIIKLLYAIECYKQGEINTGDIYLNSVEKTPNKTKKVHDLLTEIRQKKRFYQNRQQSEDSKKLVFIRPNKKRKT